MSCWSMIPKSVERWQDHALGNLGRDDDLERNVIPFWAVWMETRPGCRCKHRDVDDA
jgi:hypothetical protein